MGVDVLINSYKNEIIRVLLDISKEWLNTNQVDSAIELLAKESRASLIKFRSHLFATSGQPDSAIQTLQRGLKLDEPQNQAYLDYMQFRLDTTRTDMDSLDEASLTFLRSLGSKEHQAGVWALNLLERVTGERFDEEFDPIPDDIETVPVDFSRTGEVVPHVLQVFPNPAGDIVYVLGTFEAEQTGFVELMGMQGERLASQLLRAGEMIYFDLTKYPNGVYTVRLEGIDQRDAVRFIHHQ